MPSREAKGEEWQKMADILNPDKYPWVYPILFANQKYMRSYRLLRGKVKRITRMMGGERPLSFTDRELEDLADAFGYLARVNPGKSPEGRSIARFFRTGDLDRRIA